MTTMNDKLAEVSSTGCPALVVLDGGWGYGLNCVTGIIAPVHPEDTAITVSTVYHRDGVGWDIDGDVPPTFVAIDKITRVSYEEN